MVELHATDTELTLTPVDLTELSECGDIFEALEYHLANGWDIIYPEEVAALTSGLLLSDDSERDDQGNLTYLGRVYWDSQYQVQDALEELQAGRTVTFVAGKEVENE